MHFFSINVSMAFADAVAAAKDALERQKFSILAEIDMHQILKKGLSVDVRPYLILSACSLPLAYRTIEADDVIGSMLLCDLVVQERKDGFVEISVVDPACTIGAINHVEMISIAEELRLLVQNVMQDIEAAAKISHAA
ncbi:DUF302 domain-containing protein [Bradyrhizobium japonicum]|uniref:DUF302 domain-containing protein n=1 Tax=Bradyrhizobium japonicum TaxID=375 RepID=UPI001BADBEF0|nr:DUF302 domain-containing protein [Bradyrhizobium japonicum]MBR0764878.1 DUF302 domain-containing protein [Bradyrhizobium japonicum]